MVVSTSSNLQSSKYKCFWDFLHVQTGAQIIAALVLFNCLMSLLDTIFIQEDKCGIFLIVQYISIFAEALFFGIVLLGIRRSDAGWFRSSLVYTAYWAVVYGVGSISFLIAADSKSSLGRSMRRIIETDGTNNKATDDVLAAGIVFNAAKMVIALFFFDILYRCSKYLTEKSRQERNAHVLPVVVQ